MFPQVEYNDLLGCSVTGGLVRRGRAIVGLDRTYFNDDFRSGWINSFGCRGGAVVDRVDHTHALGTISTLSSVGFDGFGELYVTSSSEGSVFKMVARP